jgi:hypothetical protein
VLLYLCTLNERELCLTSCYSYEVHLTTHYAHIDFSDGSDLIVVAVYTHYCKHNSCIVLQEAIDKGSMDPPTPRVALESMKTIAATDLAPRQLHQKLQYLWRLFSRYIVDVGRPSDNAGRDIVVQLRRFYLQTPNQLVKASEHVVLRWCSDMLQRPKIWCNKPRIRARQKFHRSLFWTAPSW